MELNKLLKGNVLIGSRAIGKAKPDSDWDIVCTWDTYDFVKEYGNIDSIEEHSHGYEICEKLESNEYDEYERSDQGGFGADLQTITSIKFKNGLYINLFVYQDKKKFKLYKKLIRELKKELKEVKADCKQEWVDIFIDLQYELGISKG